MSASQVRWAADTEVIRLLDSEWSEIAESPRGCVSVSGNGPRKINGSLSRLEPTSSGRLKVARCHTGQNGTGFLQRSCSDMTRIR